MDIHYNITEYFDENNLFDSNISDDLTIKQDSDKLFIAGNSRDLIELADLLVNLALHKSEGAHIHIDDLTLLNKESDFSEIIIQKK